MLSRLRESLNVPVQAQLKVNTFLPRLSLFCLAVTAFAAPAPAREAANKPMYGAWGFDVGGADLKTKPGDDFFRYANGTWIDKTQIPPDKPAYSLRLAMTDLTEQRLHEMMESLANKNAPNPSTLEEKVGAFTTRSWTSVGRKISAPKRSTLP